MIEVRKPGFYTTVQDLGRKDYQTFGMPVSGVMDADAFHLANWLVQNRPNTAVLEITLVGPQLLFKTATVIAVTGANFELFVNDVQVQMNATLFVKAGSKLSFGKLLAGCRAYVAFAGGLQLQKEMGSFATYELAGVGGLYGKKITKGDFLKLKGTSIEIKPKQIPANQLGAYFSLTVVRVTKGPEFDLLSEANKDCLFQQEFIIGNNSNRMGYRLEDALPDALAYEMLSSGIVNGTVQLPPQGTPVILLAEAQTVGGYPRILNVIKADLPILGQAKPGGKLRFRLVQLEEAQAIYHNKIRQQKSYLIGE